MKMIFSKILLRTGISLIGLKLVISFVFAILGIGVIADTAQLRYFGILNNERLKTYSKGAV